MFDDTETLLRDEFWSENDDPGFHELLEKHRQRREREEFVDQAMRDLFGETYLPTLARRQAC